MTSRTQPRLETLASLRIRRGPTPNQVPKTEAGPFDHMIDDLVATTRRDALRFGLGARARAGDDIAMRDGALAAILLGYEGDQATAFVVAFVERRRVRAWIRFGLFGVGWVIALGCAFLLRWMGVW